MKTFMLTSVYWLAAITGIATTLDIARFFIAQNVIKHKYSEFSRDIRTGVYAALDMSDYDNQQLLKDLELDALGLEARGLKFFEWSDQNNPIASDGVDAVRFKPRPNAIVFSRLEAEFNYLLPTSKLLLNFVGVEPDKILIDLAFRTEPFGSSYGSSR